MVKLPDSKFSQEIFKIFNTCVLVDWISNVTFVREIQSNVGRVLETNEEGCVYV